MKSSARRTRSPFAEGEIGGHDDRGALIEPVDEVEEKLATGLGEGQIAATGRADVVGRWLVPKGNIVRRTTRD